MRCKNCGNDELCTCICGFCTDCINKYGHSELVIKYARKHGKDKVNKEGIKKN